LRNQTITQKSSLGSKPSTFKAGDDVVNIYDPKKTARFHINNDRHFRLQYMIMGGLALVFFLVGLIGSFPVLRHYF
jgi:hypothetical protein